MQKLNMAAFSKIKPLGDRVCEKCGQNVPIFERDGRTVSECLYCDSLRVQAEAVEFKEAADRRRQERLFEKYSLIPTDLLKAKFENYQPQNDATSKAKNICQGYAANFEKLEDKNSLLLQGSYGLGKSHLAYSICQEVKAAGKLVIFITMPELLNVLRDSYSRRDRSELEILTACKDADLLILDDMGAEYVKQDDDGESWATDKIFQIVNSRIDKPNVFTTNLKSDELAAKYGRYGGRIISRMMSGTSVIKFEGKDYRLQGW